MTEKCFHTSLKYQNFLFEINKFHTNKYQDPSLLMCVPFVYFTSLAYIKKLQLFQNKCLRIINTYQYYTDMYSELNIPFIEHYMPLLSKIINKRNSFIETLPVEDTNLREQNIFCFNHNPM